MKGTVRARVGWLLVAAFLLGACPEQDPGSGSTDVSAADAEAPADADASAGSRDAQAADAAPDATADAGEPCGDGVVASDEVCDPGIDRCCAADCSNRGLCPRTCAELRGLGLASTTGVHDVDPDRDGENDLPVYCDFETDGGDWTLLFKKSRLAPGSAGSLWVEGSTNARDRELLGRELTDRDYANPLIGYWELFSEARVEVLTGTVAEKLIRFDATGTSSVSWFAPERHVASGWTDLPTDPMWENGSGRFFSIGTGSRTFYINNNWGGCPSDTGWLMVSSSDFCPWERTSGDPVDIIFATGETRGNPNSSAQTGRADSLVVFAR